MKKPEAILFDWDNTIADTWAVIYTAQYNTFVEMGEEPWTLEETKRRLGISMRNSFPMIFGDKADYAMQVYRKHYDEASARLYPLFDGVLTLLEYIKANNIYTAVVSNKTGCILRREAKELNMEKYFDKIIGATDAVRDKPHPEPIYMALSDSGIIPGDHVWFVGDSIVDMECAVNSGCYPVFFGNDTKELYIEPKIVFSNYTKLLDDLKLL